jgi:hypothetical protein
MSHPAARLAAQAATINRAIPAVIVTETRRLRSRKALPANPGRG